MAELKLKDKKAWNKSVRINTDGYGKAVVDVARRVMELLDDEDEYDVHEIIVRADKDVHNGQSELSGFQAGAVSSTIYNCHERGDEFVDKWESQYKR